VCKFIWNDKHVTKVLQNMQQTLLHFINMKMQHAIHVWKAQMNRMMAASLNHKILKILVHKTKIKLGKKNSEGFFTHCFNI